MQSVLRGACGLHYILYSTQCYSVRIVDLIFSARSNRPNLSGSRDHVITKSSIPKAWIGKTSAYLRSTATPRQHDEYQDVADRSDKEGRPLHSGKRVGQPRQAASQPRCRSTRQPRGITHAIYAARSTRAVLKL